MEFNTKSLESHKSDTLNHEIGHGKLETSKLNTLDLEIVHGKLRIPQIKHFVLKKWAL
jgi:hypothetical protein